MGKQISYIILIGGAVDHAFRVVLGDNIICHHGYHDIRKLRETRETVETSMGRYKKNAWRDRERRKRLGPLWRPVEIHASIKVDRETERETGGD